MAMRLRQPGVPVFRLASSGRTHQNLCFMRCLQTDPSGIKTAALRGTRKPKVYSPFPQDRALGHQVLQPVSDRVSNTRATAGHARLGLYLLSHIATPASFVRIYAGRFS